LLLFFSQYAERTNDENQKNKNDTRKGEMMDKRKDNIQKSIDDFTEWQDNQYNPGHWIGGITPNNLLSPKKPKIVGIALILIGLSLVVPFILLITQYLAEGTPRMLIEQIYIIAQMILVGGFALLLLIGGIRKVIKR
jgi:hypothetical protein